MDLRQDNQSENSLIVKILFAIRKNLFLILAIVIFATSLGVGYSYIKKPNYTASIRINASNGEKENATTDTINELRVCIDSVIEFCGQGVVVDRANAYYVEWIDNYQQDYYAAGKTVEDFFDVYKNPKEEGQADYNTIFLGYSRPSSSQPGTLKDENFILAGSISTQTAQIENATNWVYTVDYTDANQLDAYEKAFILVLAYKHELYWDNDLKNEFGNDDIEEYFSIDIKVDSLGCDGVFSDVSKTKIVLIAFIIGLVVALAIVYLRNKLDHTVKDKDEFERLSGTQVIGTINYVKEKDKNGK